MKESVRSPRLEPVTNRTKMVRLKHLQKLKKKIKPEYLRDLIACKKPSA